MKAQLTKIVQKAGSPVQLIFETYDPEMLSLSYGKAALMQEKDCDLFFKMCARPDDAQKLFDGVEED